jgi:putative membrane protein
MHSSLSSASSSARRLLPVAALVVAFAARPALAQQPTPAPAKSAALDDPTIVAIFDAANTWDIETGALAAKKGTTQEVREFGKMLERDHKMVRQQGRDLAKKLSVTPTPPKDFAMARDHDAAVAKLRAASGTAFDRAFLEHEVAFHRAVIEAVTSTLLPALHNQEVKELVTKVAPAFQAHMVGAQNLLDKQPKVANAR